MSQIFIDLGIPKPSEESDFARLGISGLLRLILACELPFVGRLVGTNGVASLIIRPQDVLNACPRPRLGGYHSADLMRILAINASGIALITTNNLINYEEQRDPHTGRKVRTFTPEDLGEFQRKYISLSHVATRLNTLPKHAAARLRVRGIHPLPARGLCSKIYRREDIDFI
ncbi:hypothetical protein [Roseinatronobacter monicus]|uniref:hypothetical protein n=1 Tax=Roseinatronobacter monicus TaxID=393481 RepID=UPI00115425DA|nr:hypothetical protein [Roseinatronobacter monicus]